VAVVASAAILVLSVRGIVAHAVLVGVALAALLAAAIAIGVAAHRLPGAERIAVIAGRWPLRYVGRARSASPSEGTSSWHAANQPCVAMASVASETA